MSNEYDAAKDKVPRSSLEHSAAGLNLGNEEVDTDPPHFLIYIQSGRRKLHCQ